MIRDLFEDSPIIGGIITLLFAFIVFFIIDTAGLLTTPEHIEGTIVDKQYESESNRTGTGTAIGANGNVGIITTYEYEAEKFLLIIRTKNGEIKTVYCSPELYYSKEKGQLLLCDNYKGLITGSSIKIYGIK